MATDTNILREFLISIGFKVENADRFKETIENATKMVGKFGVALEAMGIAGLSALNKVANKYRDLEYMSQRLNGTPIRSIMAFEAAMKRSGVSAEEAKSTLDSFGDFLRGNPRALQILEGRGIHTRDAQGHVRSVTDLAYQWGNIAKGMTQHGRLYEARGWSQQFGISDNALDALMRNPQEKAAKYEEDLKKKGITDAEIKKRADALARWADRWDEFTSQLAVFTDMWISKIQPIFDKILNWIKLADAKTNGLSTQFLALGAALLPILTFGNPIIAVIAGIAGGLALLFEDFENWKKNGKSLLPWGEWSPTLKEIWRDITDIGKVLGDVFGGASLGNLGKVLSGFVKDELGALRDMLGAILEGLKAIQSFKSGNVKEGFGHVGEALKGAGKAVFVDQFKALQHEAQNWTAPDKGKPPGPMSRALSGFIDKGGQVSGSIAKFFASKGLAPDKITEIMAGIFAESRFNPNARGPADPKTGHRAFGIGQWLSPDRVANMKRFTGTDTPNLQQQLEFMWWELNGGDKGGRSVLNAQGRGATLRAYATNYMRAGDGIPGDIHRGNGWLSQNGGDYNQTITTNIYVHGTDPQGTADAIKRHQQRVYSDAVRLNKPAAS